MRKVITGEQVAQLYNDDPFAVPVWRAPVYQTPAGIIVITQLVRLLAWLVRLIARHPLAATIAAVLVLAWLNVGWLGLVLVVAWTLVVLATWRYCWPGSFTRWIAGPARSKWRGWWCYRRRWAGVMAISGIAPWHQGRVIVPVLGEVAATRYIDRVAVRLVSGQSPADIANHAEALAHGFGALLCRVRSARSGRVVLEFVRRDALALIVPALPIPDRPDLKALPVGRREDGLPWLVRLHSTHVLIAGATGAGKASLLWSLVRAMFPLLRAGLARILAADPKLMELAYCRVIFETHGAYAADPVAIAALLEQAVADMQARAARFAGVQRDHTPTVEYPFVVILVDEVAFLTAYQLDRKLKDRIMAALATLTTQGRAAGYCVVAALQDPRKDVLAIRNLFPGRIAMRLDEPEQTDTVLGDGARDRGAACELISSDPSTGAGVAYVRLEGDPDPVRVRAGWVPDADIRAMVELAALRRCDIDMQARTVRISRQLSEPRGGGFAFGPPKSQAGHRVVAVPDMITADLASHIVTYAAPGDDGLVFTSPDGAPLRLSNFSRRAWRPALRASGLPMIHFHHLRHTGNQLAAHAGASLRELMDRMGHSTTRAAMAYLHGSDERQQAIADELSRQAAVALKRPGPGRSGTQRARRRGRAL